MTNLQIVEVWKEITKFPGYTGYEVSNRGRVRCWNSRNRNANPPITPRILKPNYSSNGGYAWVTIYGQGAPMKARVHDLVANEFLEEKPEGHWILHLDGDPKNNVVENLRYGTPTQNSLDKSILNDSKHVLRYLDDVGRFCLAISTSKGFWDHEPSPDVYLAKMALIHSEVSEILEAYRKSQGNDKLTEEFADVFIRLVDLWAAMEEDGLVGSLRDSILAKMKTNLSRQRKHGNLI